MLERLADMLRKEDSRGGFEANADMLSISGMTLEQFAGLMDGLGYRAERGEREKVRSQSTAEDDAVVSEAVEAGAETAPKDSVPEKDDPNIETPPKEATQTDAPEPKPVDENEGPTIEVFFKFTWGGTRGRQQQRPDRKPQSKARPRSKPRPKSEARDKPKNFQARPPKKDRIDPDNPFAQALMGLKDKGS